MSLLTYRQKEVNDLRFAMPNTLVIQPKNPQTLRLSEESSAFLYFYGLLSYFKATGAPRLYLSYDTFHFK